MKVIIGFCPRWFIVQVGKWILIKIFNQINCEFYNDNEFDACIHFIFLHFIDGGCSPNVSSVYILTDCYQLVTSEII